LKAQEAVQKGVESASEMAVQKCFRYNLLAAMVQDGDGIVPLCSRRSVFRKQVAAEALKEIDRLPKVSGGGVQAGAAFAGAQKFVLSKRPKRPTPLRTKYVSTEHLLLARPGARTKNDADAEIWLGWASHEAILKALASVRGTQRVYGSESRSQIPGSVAVFARSDGIGAQGEAGPGDWARRGDSAPGAGAVAANEENPVLIGEPGVGKTGESSKAWRSASSRAMCRKSCGISAWYRSTWEACWRGRSFAASSKTA